MSSPSLCGGIEKQDMQEACYQTHETEEKGSALVNSLTELHMEGPSTNKRPTEPQDEEPPNKQICEVKSDPESMECLPSISENGNSGSVGNTVSENSQERSLDHAETTQKIQSMKTTHCSAPPPGPIQFTSIKSDSISLLWGPAEGLDAPQKFIVTCKGERIQGSEVVTGSQTYIPYLFPGKKYEFTVVTITEDGQQSECVSASAYTEIPAPLGLKVAMHETSAKVSWRKPEELDKATYVVSLSVDGEDQSCLCTISTESTEHGFSNLELDVNYTVGVSVALQNGFQSKIAKQSIRTVPGPDNLKVVSVTATSAELKWQCQAKQPQPSFLISYQRLGEETNPQTGRTDSCSTCIKGLYPGSEYTVTVFTLLQHGGKSLPSSTTFRTSVPRPEKPRVVSVTTTSATITWRSPHELDNVTHSFEIKVKGTEQIIRRDVCDIDIPNLEPDTKYTVSICAVVNGQQSAALTIQLKTEIQTITFSTLVIGNTQNNHRKLEDYLVSQGLTEAKTGCDADIILAFCVIVSRVGTDMEAALRQIPDTRPTLLVVMHHTFDPDYVIPDTSRFARGMEITVVDILFHEDKGILICQKNQEAKRKMMEVVRCVSFSRKGTPQNSKSLSTADELHPAGRHSDGAEGEKQASFQTSKIQNPAASTTKEIPPNKKNLSNEVSRQSASSLSSGSGKVTYFTLVSGNTLGIHEKIRERILEKASLTKVPSMEHCELILAFCPIVSSVQLDIERACKRIPDSKAAILVVMHHTFNPDHVPIEGSGYAKRSNLLVVHCLFHEDQGFLKCLRNDEVVDSIITWLQQNFPNSVNHLNTSSIGSGLSMGKWKSYLPSWSL
ncbi:hypothetical protein ACEWY4_024998 [Coilia grayii]|uniref:Fibronectin type-III domain-containing protein n=1 Tax=Coilia grayii TaxID=363190 RepID=A0ABD1IXC5_9TELE